MKKFLTNQRTLVRVKYFDNPEHFNVPIEYIDSIQFKLHKNLPEHLKKIPYNGIIQYWQIFHQGSWQEISFSLLEKIAIYHFDNLKISALYDTH